jgi:hypothetical protein
MQMRECLCGGTVLFGGGRVGECQKCGRYDFSDVFIDFGNGWVFAGGAYEHQGPVNVKYTFDPESDNPSKTISEPKFERLWEGKEFSSGFMWVDPYGTMFKLCLPVLSEKDEEKAKEYKQQVYNNLIEYEGLLPVEAEERIRVSLAHYMVWFPENVWERMLKWFGIEPDKELIN